MMRKFWINTTLLAGFAALMLLLPTEPPSRYAKAGVSCSVPFNLTNGTTADASQVMANYNAILTCLSGNTAASGANSDITSILGLTTPLSASQGGSTVFVGGTSAGTNTVTLANPVPNGFSYTAGAQVIFIVGGTNTGATTLNVNALGAKNVFKQTAAGPVALTGGELVATQLVAAVYDGTQFEISPANITPVGIGQVSAVNPPYGFDAAVNLQLNVTTGANALTIAVKSTALNADPTAASPVLIPFHNITGAVGNTNPGPNGNPVWESVTSALSVTIPAGQTLGTSNNTPFRFWIVAMDRVPVSGVVELAVINCSTATQIFPLAEHNLIATSAISSALTAGVFYSTSSRNGLAYKILGYLEFSSGLATAGTYTGSPTNVQLFGPGVRKPGDVVQTVVSNFAGTLTTVGMGAGFTSSNITLNITPTSSANLVSYAVSSTESTVGNAATVSAQMYRNSTAVSNLSRLTSPVAGTALNSPFSLVGIDAPGTVSATTYVVKGTASGGASNIPAFSSDGAIEILQEIMGALSPANDNSGPLSMTG